VIGVSLGKLTTRGALLRGELDEIFKLYAAGKVKPVIGKTFPLADAVSAHKYIQARKNIGKVILSVK
jgi:NADPH2:quinone reductase